MSPPGPLDLGTDTRGTLLFFVGFMVSPPAYRSLLGPVADAGFRVVVPRLYRRTPTVALGRLDPRTEASRACALAEALAADSGSLVLGGHSRGGLVAWLAAATVAPRGTVLVDPVSGGGPPWSKPAPVPDPPPGPVRVIGCGVGGPCAPEGRNHLGFAHAVAGRTGCDHVVVERCGHADVLDGASGRLGRIACGHGDDPAAARAEMSARLVEFVAATGRAG